MNYDGKLDIATGMGARSKLWKNKKILWSDLVKKLSETNFTNETFKEFISATKEEQLKIKDVGGYVGGYLRNGRRKPENVVHRQLLTLDIDYAHKDFWDLYTLMYGNAAILHATHKYSDASPRYRLIIPLSREASPDEYVAVARQIAGFLDIELFDNTTFETNRLMFWPSTPKDVEYYFQFQDGPWVDVDEVLNSYTDWTDTSLWPTANKNIQEVRDASKKQEDPETKRGIIGAWCRAYTMQEVIELFLSDVYSPTDMQDRYTYTKGSAAAGLIVYDDKFAYSHHGTDPCGGKLCNAFDLVRVHKFGHLDSSPNPNESKLKSFKGMEEFARSDNKVKRTIANETMLSVKYDFAEEPEEQSDLKWTENLEIDTKGKYISSAININAILANDANLKKAFKQNDFDGKRYVFRGLPWRRIEKPEPVKNVDYSGVRNYIESIYGVTGNLKIDDSLALEFEKQSFHPIKEYLEALEWDGEERLDNLLINAFGAPNNIYSKEAIRKCLVAAVARVYKPGIKFDLVLTLCGKQSTGKSTFFNRLGKKWFSDTFMTVTGKEAYEQIQGSWIIEMAELAGLRKAEVESVKHFISKQEDTFRPAYARTSETYPRQCIFVGTTNNSNFLRDPSGNRRFLPVDVHDVKILDNPFFKEFDNDYIDQVWAEAVYLYNEGEALYLSKEAEAMAEAEQKSHSELDERRGVIENYLNKKLPEDWEGRDIYERRRFFSDELEPGGINERAFVCVAEIWCECLCKDKEDMDRYKTREINEILRGLDEWEASQSTKNFKLYGKQKYYSRRR